MGKLCRSVSDECPSGLAKCGMRDRSILIELPGSSLEDTLVVFLTGVVGLFRQIRGAISDKLNVGRRQGGAHHGIECSAIVSNHLKSAGAPVHR